MHIIIEDIDETYVIAETDSWLSVEDVMNGRGFGPLTLTRTDGRYDGVESMTITTQGVAIAVAYRKDQL